MMPITSRRCVSPIERGEEHGQHHQTKAEKEEGGGTIQQQGENARLFFFQLDDEQFQTGAQQPRGRSPRGCAVKRAGSWSQWLQ
jgi:hypothetical protein